MEIDEREYKWRAQWFGSGKEKGSWIRNNLNSNYGRLFVHVGEDHHDQVHEIVEEHNRIVDELIAQINSLDMHIEFIERAARYSE